MLIASGCHVIRDCGGVVSLILLQNSTKQCTVHTRPLVKVWWQRNLSLLFWSCGHYPNGLYIVVMGKNLDSLDVCCIVLFQKQLTLALGPMTCDGLVRCFKNPTSYTSSMQVFKHSLLAVQLIPPSISLKQILKGTSPSISPWRIPLVTGLHLGMELLSATLWIWPSSQFHRGLKACHCSHVWL